MMGRIRQVVRSVRVAMRYCLRLTDDAACGEGSISPTAVAAWGVILGLVFCGVFSVSWKFFGDLYFSDYSKLRLVPSGMVILVGSVLGFKQLLGLAVTVDRLAGQSPALSSTDDSGVVDRVSLAGILAVFLVILLKFSALLAMRYHTPWWPGPEDWRHVFNRLYPRMHFRVLVLFALWGKVGLLVAGGTGSAGSMLSRGDRMFRRGLTIKSLLFNLLIVGALTSVYFSSSHNRVIGILMSLSIFLLLYLVSMLLASRQGGHDRHSMFACAELGELVLLMGYLVVARSWSG